MRNIGLLAVAGALLAGPSLAADLPRRAAPPILPVVPVFTWTGIYGGLESTYVFTDRQRITTVGLSPVNAAAVAAGTRPARTSIRDDGFANIGGTVGYNYQFTPGGGLVIGVANSIDWTDLSRRRTVLGNPAGGVIPVNTFRHSLDFLGTFVGRVGVAFDRVMVYGMGGLAYGQTEHRANFFAGGAGLAFGGRSDRLDVGFAYGGGIEVALPTDSFFNTFAIGRLIGLKYEALTLKAEYVHYDLGSRNTLVAPVPGVGAGAGYISRFRTEGNAIRVGFNYKFGGF